MISIILSKFKLWLAGAGALVVVIALAFWRGLAAGKSSAAAAQTKARDKALNESKAIENETRQMDDADLDRDNARWLRK